MRSTFQLVEGTDPAETGLITLEQLKIELGITGETQNQTLEAQIARQSLLIAEYLNRTLAASEAIETFYFDHHELYRPGPWPVLVLRLYPVTEVFSVTIDGVEVDAGNIRLDASSGRLWLANSGWGGVVEVRYSGGYDLPGSAPSMLSTAVIEAIRQARAFASADPSIRETSHGDTRVGYYSAPMGAAGLPDSVIDLLQPFRRLTAV